MKKLKLLKRLDRFLISEMHDWGIKVLRITLGIVFLWFGALKIFDLSPVTDLIAETYGFLPQDAFLLILGIWEVLIGIGLLAKFYLRVTLALLWLQMAGVIFAIILAPSMFYLQNNPLLLTVEGEFVLKNIVLIAAGLVIGGFEIKRRRWIFR